MVSRDMIETLIKQAYKGDESALSRLRYETARMTKTANSRIARLREKDIDMYAVARIENYLDTETGTKYLPTGTKTMDIDTLETLARETSLFLSRKTSTVTGVKEYEVERLEYFGDKWDIDLSQLSATERREFGRFLGEDTVSQFMRDAQGVYMAIMDKFAQDIHGAQDRDAVKAKFRNSINQFLSGRLRFDELEEALLK